MLCFPLTYIFEVWRDVGFGLVCVPHPSCGGRRPVYDRTSCSTWMKASSMARMTPMNTACVISKLWNKKKTTLSSTEVMESGKLLAIYLASHVSTGFRNSHYTVNALDLKHNSRKWRVHVNGCVLLRNSLDYTEEPANASNYVLNKAAGFYRNDQSKKKNTLLTVTRHSFLSSKVYGCATSTALNVPYSAKFTPPMFPNNNMHL